MDRGAWRTTVHGVTKSRTRLKRLSSKTHLVQRLKHLPASACNAGDLGSIPGLGRSPGEGHGNPLQYSCLENPMDKGAWRTTVHEIAKSQTRLRD